MARPFVKTISLGGLTIVYNEVDPGVIYTLQYVSMMVIAFFLFVHPVTEFPERGKAAACGPS